MYQNRNKTNNKGPNLLLLFGMPRSGTTWMGKIIDSHPDVIYRHEPDSEYRLQDIPLLVETETEALRLYKSLLKKYTENLSKYCSVRICGKLPIFKKSYLSAFQAAALKNSLLFSSACAKIFGRFPVWNPLYGSIEPSLTIAWKSIESVGRISVILQSVTESKIIFIIRHPCGQIASVLNGETRGSFIASTPSSEDYGVFSILLETAFAKNTGLTLDKLKSFSPIERLAWRWTLFNEKAVHDVSDTNDRGLLIRYEDLCRNPKETARAMFDFSGLEWCDQTDVFIQKSISGKSDSYYSVFKSPEVSMNRWRDQLSTEDIEKIRKVVRKSRAGKLFEQDF